MVSKALTINPIGTVRVEKGSFWLDIFPKYADGLNQLENFSHVNVLWWCHHFDNAKDRQVLQCEQPYQKAPASVGIFATRSPLRPNPIALTIVPIINIAEGGKIYLPYIDAEDGSPIIDLKPYHPATDRVRDLEVPDWCRHWPQWYEDSASFDWEAELINAK